MPVLTDRNEKLIRLALLAVYMLALWRFQPYWQFATDDGRVLRAAQGLKQGLFWWGPTSSIGVLHPPYVYYLHALFLDWSNSVSAAQAGVALAALSAHWILIGTVRKLYSAGVAYSASVVSFTNPAFLVLYTQRFWEPVFLPVLSMLAFASLLAYLRERHWRYVFFCLVAVTFASGAHFASLCYLPVVGLVVADQGGVRRWGLVPSLLCLSVLLLALLPIFHWFVASGHPERAGYLCGVLGICLCALVWPPQKLRTATVLRITLPLLFVGSVVYFFAAPRRDPLARVISLLNISGAESYAYSLTPYHPPTWPGAIAPILAACFFLSLAWRLRESSEEQRLFAAWIAVPFVLLLLLAPFSKWIPIHWLLFLFPVAWVACFVPLFQIPWGRMGFIPPLFVAAIVGFQATHVFEVEEFIRNSGGIGEYTANLSKKREVLGRIFSGAGNPAIFLMLNPWSDNWDYDAEAWKYLAGEMDGNRPPEERAGGGPSRAYYILQPQAGNPSPLLAEAIREAKGFREEKFGPVVLYSTDKPEGGAGLRIR